MAENQASNAQLKENFLFALSNYSECIKPFLRTAQDRYIGQLYLIEDQEFDFTKYCVAERTMASKARAEIEASMQL